MWNAQTIVYLEVFIEMPDSYRGQPTDFMNLKLYSRKRANLQE